MNYRRKLSSKVAMVAALVVLAALLITFVAVPAGALNKAPLLHGGGDVLNTPDPAIPTLINYQGTLLDPATGNPVADGQYQFVFSIYDSASGGTPLWTETQQVTVENGLFSALLGNQTALSASVFEGSPRYLGIKVGADPEMTPRQLLTSVAYAFQAENADTLDGLHSADFVAVAGDTMTGTLNLPANGLVVGGDQLVITGMPGGNVGIGTATPLDKLHVIGRVLIQSSWGHGVTAYGGSGGSGVVGVSDGSNYGVKGRSTGGYAGVYGEHTATGNYGELGNNHYGVFGESDSGYGVYGMGDTYGVYGFAVTYGVYGYGDYGVYGYGNGSGNHGILGTDNCGVYGFGMGIGGVGSWDFYAAGGGPNYGPFTGAHEVKLSGDFPENIKPGMIVSVTGETQVRTDEERISFSSTLPTVQLSDMPNDSRVLGVFISECPLGEDHWYISESGEADRFGIVNALGEGRVWVTNINGDIEAGDYITTSLVAGYGQKQADDLLHSYTLGKAIENVDWSIVTETVDFNGHTYQAYPIAVVYTSG